MSERVDDMIKTEGDDNFQPNERTVYAAGLTRDTTDADVEMHFSIFGKVDNINHKVNLVTNESRGFAFVTFHNMDDFERAMNADEHIIKNKKIVVKKAQPKQGIIFVGGLPKEDELSDEAIKTFFSRFGAVDGIKHPADKVNGGKKPFCFVYFQSADTAKSLISRGKVVLDGYTLEIGRATLNQQPNLGVFGRGPHLQFPGNMTAFGPVAGYSGLPFPYGGMPYGGFMPNVPAYGGFESPMQIGFNGGMPLGQFRGRGRGVSRGRGGMRGQRNRPY